MEIPSNPGAPGDAKYVDKSDDVVGILANGILLDSHQPTWAYDSCNGHSDTKHHYHYHIPPQCFLKTMGIATPEDSEWWIHDQHAAGKDQTVAQIKARSGHDKYVRDFTEMAEQWPKTSNPSPVIGFARDGYPIYGPYDESGKVMRGMWYGSDLDECNGRVNINGEYGYYLTVDPPFAPPCLRGEVGKFMYTSSNAKCPADGIVSQIIDVEGSSCADFGNLLECIASEGDKTDTETVVEVPSNDNTAVEKNPTMETDFEKIPADKDITEKYTSGDKADIDVKETDVDGSDSSTGSMLRSGGIIAAGIATALTTLFL